MTQHQTLHVFEILGDYVRNGRPLPVTHPLMQAATSMLDNRALHLMYLEEANLQLQDLAQGYTMAARSITGDANRLHKAILPAFCRLHSVLHGFHYWQQHTGQKIEEDCKHKLAHLQLYSGQLTQDFTDNGLTFESAQEILIPYGREIIDPSLKCYACLPANTAASLALSSNDYRPEIPRCFTR